MDHLILVSTWEDGVITLSQGARSHELAGRSVRGLAADGQGGALAVVDGQSLQRRSHGAWETILDADTDLACCVAVGRDVFVGTEQASILRVADSRVEVQRAFDHVPGRERWYAGTAIVNGKVVGPPLGIRSLCVTAGGVLLANVHVGGIPRSRDLGQSWQPTIEIETDVHEVRAHPDDPMLVAAAAGAGLCVSHDGGAHWQIETDGLHAVHCSAVAFAGRDILVSAAVEQFARDSAIYRRPADSEGPLTPVAGGLPRWLDGVVDTACIASRSPSLAFVDGGGHLYVSADAGRSWSMRERGLPAPSGVLLL